ncbi:MAG: FHA domain-containing protein [Bdellovibrionales bacterium]
MRHALAPHAIPETKWTAVAGPMKGVVRLMHVAQFTMGRSTDCDFVIVNDPKCSRHHATIVCTPTHCEAHSASDANPIYINDEAVERAKLRDGDVIRLGETEIQFNLNRRPDPAHLAVVRSQAHGAPSPGAQGYAQAYQARRKPSGGNPARLVIYVVLALMAVWLFTPTGKKKKKDIDVRTQEQINADIEAANKLREAAESQMAAKKLDGSVNSKQAQENYLRGIRDYRKHQYERSLISFQACLAMQPDHVLCNHYSRIAKRKFDELVQYHMVLGKRYRDQNQFGACVAAFRNVIFMVKDANSPIYKEAKANHDACLTAMEGRY